MPRIAWLRTIMVLAVVLVLGGESLGLAVASAPGPLAVTVAPVPVEGGYRFTVVLTNVSDHPVTVELDERQFRVEVRGMGGIIWQHDGRAESGPILAHS